MKIFTLKSSILVATALAVGFSGCAPKKSCNTSVQKIAKKPVVKVEASQPVVQKVVQAPRVIVKSESTLYPPNAVPGHCYARVLTPAKYKTVTEKVLVKEASERLVTIPAKYGYKTQKVLVKEPSEKIVVIPATYKTVTEKVLVSPASERVVTVPAKYKTATEKVLVAPAQTVWKRGNKRPSSRGNCACTTGDCDRLPGETGEVMCLVNKPAQYRTITKKVLVSPAKTKTIPVPAVYKTVTKRVVDRPATTKTIPVPAVYKTVKVKTIIQPETTKSIPVPAQYRTVTKKVLVEEPVLTWKEVRCKSVRH